LLSENGRYDVCEHKRRKRDDSMGYAHEAKRIASREPASGKPIELPPLGGKQRQTYNRRHFSCAINPCNLMVDEIYSAR
jgi:hypothetical protein